jgi:predicted anti-sigma-YlaC factor YlaD
MKPPCEEYEVLISGYLDGELEPGAQRVLEDHVQGCTACRREYESMKRLVVGSRTVLAVAEPPPHVWDTFLDTVYNRLERKTAWSLFILGMFALGAYSVVWFYQVPWASVMLKTLISVPALGMILLFISVLRQRLRIARTDRYSREVHR